VLDDIYNKLVEQEKPNGSNQPTNQSEPVKQLNNRKKKLSAQQLTEGHTEPKKETVQ